MQRYSDEDLMLKKVNNSIDFSKLPTLEEIKESIKDAINIGKGQFGKVYRFHSEKSEKSYAIKIMSKKKIKQLGMVDAICREVSTMYQCEHPNIIKLYGHFEDQTDIYLLMEIAVGGSLYSIYKEKKRFDEKTANGYIFQIIKAVDYLHQLKIIHRDIKLENILLQIDGKGNESLKLCDFGSTNVSNAIRQTQTGTPVYYAPEMVLNKGHDHKVDNWCIGILTFEILAGYSPFEPMDKSLSSTKQHNSIMKNICQCKPKFPSDFPPLAKNFVNKILRLNPKSRMSCQEMLKHNWIRSFEHKQIRKPIQPEEYIDSSKSLQKFEIPEKQSKENLKQKAEEYELKNKQLQQQLDLLKIQKQKLKSSFDKKDKNHLLFASNNKEETSFKFDLEQ